MRRDPLEEGRRWLEQAQEDLRWARDLAERGGYHIACFLSQQIGEKAIKGFIYAQGEELVIGHSIERLCRAAAQWQPQFEELVKKWAFLDGYYIPTRYPNGLPDSIPARVYAQNSASEAVAVAAEIVAFIEAEFQKLQASMSSDQQQPPTGQT